MLDEHHATWAAKRSNNVGSNKVGTLNPTLFDSLARALDNMDLNQISVPSGFHENMVWVGVHILTGSQIWFQSLLFKDFRNKMAANLDFSCVHLHRQPNANTKLDNTKIEKVLHYTSTVFVTLCVLPVTFTNDKIAWHVYVTRRCVTPHTLSYMSHLPVLTQ